MTLSSFADVEDPRLRVYNRCVMFYNIMEDHGKPAAQKYASQFSKDERLEMVHLIEEVKDRGVDVVKAEIIRNLQLPEEEEVIV